MREHGIALRRRGRTYFGLCPFHTERTVRAKAIQYLVRLHARRAEIPQPLSPHQLRHACATHLLQRGADVRHVQQLLGHASLESTAIYTAVAPVDLAQAIDRAHPRSQPRRPTARHRR